MPTTQPSLARSIQINLRVCHALFLRELITRFGRHNVGFLWLLLEPMMFTLGITAIWSIAGALTGHNRSADGIPIAGFALTGYSVLMIWRNCVSRISQSINANEGLLYHQQVTIFNLAVTRAFIEFFSVTTSLLILTVFFVSIGLMRPPADPLKIITAWIFASWFSISAGLLATYLDKQSEVFERVWHVLMYLTLPLTGAFNMTNWLPPTGQKIVLYSPLVHSVEMLREGYFGSKIHAIYSVHYMLFFNIAFLFLGLGLLQKIKKYVGQSH